MTSSVWSFFRALVPRIHRKSPRRTGSRPDRSSGAHFSIASRSRSVTGSLQRVLALSGSGGTGRPYSGRGAWRVLTARPGAVSGCSGDSAASIMSSRRLRVGVCWRVSRLVLLTRVDTPVDPLNVWRAFTTVAEGAGELSDSRTATTCSRVAHVAARGAYLVAGEHCQGYRRHCQRTLRRIGSRGGGEVPTST